MISITRKAEFSASHFCSSPFLTEEQNRAVYGKAANPNGHGHNYVVEVTVEGEVDPVTGMVMDLKELKGVLERLVVEPFDHRFLNREVPPFDRITPTPENIAREIWRRLAPELNQGRHRLARVRLYETPELYVDHSERGPVE
jgi:6-pyruvoyltetrahydropterin/6-carboxytetrahydropterin synthase